jgi:hypothetical protein
VQVDDPEPVAPLPLHLPHREDCRDLHHRHCRRIRQAGHHSSLQAWGRKVGIAYESANCWNHPFLPLHAHRVLVMYNSLLVFLFLILGSSALFFLLLSYSYLQLLWSHFFMWICLLWKSKGRLFFLFYASPLG